MTDPSRLQLLIERDMATKNLGDLADFVVSRYKPGVHGWRSVATELTEATGRKVTGEALRRWFEDRLKIEVTIK